MFSALLLTGRFVTSFLHSLLAPLPLFFAQGVALQNVALALAVVFLSIAVLSGFAIAIMVSSLVLGTTLGIVGLVRTKRRPVGLATLPYEMKPLY